jgi:hypothetical protein
VLIDTSCEKHANVKSEFVLTGLDNYNFDVFKKYLQPNDTTRFLVLSSYQDNHNFSISNEDLFELVKQFYCNLVCIIFHHINKVTIVPDICNEMQKSSLENLAIKWTDKENIIVNAIKAKILFKQLTKNAYK